MSCGDGGEEGPEEEGLYLSAGAQSFLPSSQWAVLGLQLTLAPGQTMISGKSRGWKGQTKSSEVHVCGQTRPSQPCLCTHVSWASSGTQVSPLCSLVTALTQTHP